MSLPRVVTAEPDGSVHQAPAPEVDALRDEQLVSFSSVLSAEPLEVLRGDELDLELRLTIPDDGAVTISLRATDDDAEATVLHLQRRGDRAQLTLDRTRSSLDPAVDAGPRGGDVPMHPDGSLDVRILMDHSALEVFAGGVPLTARVYPTREDALGIRLSGIGVRAEVRAWTMHSVARGAAEPGAIAG